MEDHTFDGMTRTPVTPFLVPDPMVLLTPASDIPSPVPFLSPGGSRSWVPSCPLELKPKKDQEFSTLEVGIEFYQNYARECGFNTRLYNRTLKKDGRISCRHVVCNREGYKTESSKSNSSEMTVKKVKQGDNAHASTRVNAETRCGCHAKIVFTLTANGNYKVHKFIEGHNHQLLCFDAQKFAKLNRNLTIVHKHFIASNVRVNQGPVKSFRMFKEQVGGYEFIGASLVDFKNFHRDMKKYIGESDAQMLINILHQKHECSEAFFYEYAVDEKDRLIRVFWADPICIRNYYLFGDMVSFDTTYDTNKYCMVLAPFTGVDHHGKCVTFGVGLIRNEDAASFRWLFQNFLKAMGNRAPRCMITDQDPAMKGTVEEVFGGTAHRYCAWHIMRKVPEKVGVKLCKDTDFWKRLCTAVWSTDIEPAEFEDKWKGTLKDFNLEKHVWLVYIYELREHWVPAYFRDIFMGGLLRTTSRSESENSFFCYFTNPKVSLVEFYMRFESAMDAQRYTFSLLNNKSISSSIPCKTRLELEQHACDVYTHEIFRVFQDELESAMFCCGIDGMTNLNDRETSITVSDSQTKKDYLVLLNRVTTEVVCSCKRLQQEGLLCRHILTAFNAKRIGRIPEMLIMSRWTKEAPKKPIFNSEGKLLEQCVVSSDTRKKVGELWSKMISCVRLAERTEESIDDLLKRLTIYEKETTTKLADQIANTKSKNMERFVGFEAPTQIKIHPPEKTNNKGSGRRIRGGSEVAIEEQESQKKKRKCHKCGQLTNHDSRNCDTTKS